jgi:mevalonate kinase
LQKELPPRHLIPKQLGREIHKEKSDPLWITKNFKFNHFFSIFDMKRNGQTDQMAKSQKRLLKEETKFIGKSHIIKRTYNFEVFK